jgi:hypothetical protein
LNVFVNGTTADGTQVNANFNSLIAAGNNINSTNIGSLGVYANQIIPTTAGQATFGGSLAYTFPAGVNVVNGGLTVTALGTYSSPVASASGDGVFQRTASTGALFLGGATGASIDYGTTTAGTFTMSSRVVTNGSITSVGNIVSFGTTASIAATALGAVSVPSAAAAGDMIAQRSSSAGAILLGGLSSAARIDYGILVAGITSCSSQFSAPSLYATTALSIPSTAGNGDIVAQRTAASGAIFWGGASDFCAVDYSLNFAGALTFILKSGAAAPLRAASFTVVSDASLKTNVAALSGSLALIKQLKPSSFTWINGEAHDVGFVAQDVQAVIPAAVSTDNAGHLGYTPDIVLAHTVQALKELEALFRAYVTAHP